METSLFEQQHYLDAFAKAAQYLAGLTTQQDTWSEIGKAMVNFFNSDLVGFGERRADVEIIGHHWTLPDRVSCESILTAETKGIINDVLEAGFLATHHIDTPEHCSIAFLPITQANEVTAVMLVGHRTSEPLPKELLNVYLAVARLAGTMITKLASEEELRKHRGHLEALVEERTAELATAKERAEETDRLKSAFLATMSHELRTPLNSIIGFTGLVLQGLAGPLNDEQSKQLSLARDSGRHLLALINDILDLSKIEAGEVEIVKGDVAVPDLIDKVVKTVSPLAEQKGLELAVALSPEVGQIYSDRRRVEQVLLNLVNNAVKFTERGSVRIEGAIVEECLRVSVEDTGIGIKAEDMGTLFQTFRQVQTASTRDHEGTGLGLSICRKLVTMLGGEIWAESEWGVGSKFTFTLPIEKSESH